MGKKDEQKAKLNGAGNQKSRMKVFVAGFEMEGGDDVMAEGFKAIRELTTAVSRGAAVLAPVSPPKPALGAPKAGAVIPANGISEEDEAEEANSLLEPQVEEEDEEVDESANGNPKGPKRAYTFKAPKFLHDLDLSKAPKPLADFLSEKGNPTEIMDRYIVIAVWLKEQMGVEEFSINHIWTAYNSLGWKAQFPENHSQPLRDLKSKKNFLTKEKGAGYKVSWPGEQYVTKMGA